MKHIYKPKKNNKYNKIYKFIDSKNNDKQTRTTTKIIKLKKIKPKKKFTINPFLIVITSGFFYDLEKLENYKIDIDDMNKLKLTIDKLDFINILVDDIEKKE